MYTHIKRERESVLGYGGGVIKFYLQKPYINKIGINICKECIGYTYITFN